MADPLIESSFTNKDWLELAGFGLIVFGWAISIIRSLLNRDRANIDKADTELSRQVEALWKNQDELQREVVDAKKDIAVIDDRLKNIPASDRWDTKLEAVRAGLEAKMDKVLSELTKTQIKLAQLPARRELDSQS